MRQFPRLVIAIGFVCAANAEAAQDPLAPIGQPVDPSHVGRTIYRHGLLATGAPLRGERLNGLAVSGAQAACVNCHRRSGLGAVEGNSLVPPIAGAYLFQPRGSRKPYTDPALVRAIREGVDHTGRPLAALMPRFDLSDEEADALVQYLKGLSQWSSPGVSQDEIHFATIIAANVGEAKRNAMLDVLNAYFEDKNSAPRIRPRRHRVLPLVEVTWQTNYRWRLHVWELEGPPDTWEFQLRRLYSAQPVFAVLAGISMQTWEPVHRFCEATELPCLFPTVDLPVVAEQDFYSLYFSKGVLLEAGILARHLTDRGASGTARSVVQVFRSDEPGAAAAKSLSAALRQNGWRVEDRPIQGISSDAKSFGNAMSSPDDTAVLVLWLGEADLRAVTASRGSGLGFSRVYLSATLSGGESAPLPPAWKSRAAIIYPYDLPEVRAPRLAAYKSWLGWHGIKERDERVQTHAYFAAAIVAGAMSDLSNITLRDYLVEHIEAITGEKPPGSLYPRLGLGPSQRFASKGGYIVRFVSAEANRLVAETDWIVP